MLEALTCQCHSAEPLVRQVLQQAQVPNWMETPIQIGKEHCLRILETLPPVHQASLPYQALAQHIQNASAFAVILGYDDTHLYWEDVHTNAPIEVTRAIAIIKQFA